MKKTLHILLMIAPAIFLQAQNGNKSAYPEVGKLCPDFTIRNVEYYSQKTVNPSDFRGKWLILDFYDKNCGSCIAQFPRYSANQVQFSDKVQFMLIGREDKENKIRGIYAKFRNQNKLVLPCAFDSSLFKKLDINSSPYAIIIDPKGVVRYTTLYFDTEELTDIIAGKKITLRKAYREHEAKSEQSEYDRTFPYRINGNGGVDSVYLFRSLLTEFDPLKQHSSIPAKINYAKEWVEKNHIYRFEVLGAGINLLYRYAYRGEPGGGSPRDSLYGKLWPVNIVEVNDTSRFKISSRAAAVTGDNMYCYSLSLPPSRYNRDNLMSAMQRDLKTYFGYDAVLETRRMPYWKLVVTEQAKPGLKTKGEKPFSTPLNHDYYDSVVIRNKPVSFLMEQVLPLNTTTMPFIDETGIDFNIDITLNYRKSPGPAKLQLERVRIVLQQHGFDLIQGEKEMKVLVIRDPKPNPSNN